jgi:FtsH-binding integral membrane protein
MDDKFIAPSQAHASESGFIAKVYMWMVLGLVVSVAVSFALVM